jgi:hypothetical protein
MNSQDERYLFDTLDKIAASLADIADTLADIDERLERLDDE